MTTKGLIVAMDMENLADATNLLSIIDSMPEVLGYKIGSVLGLRYGLGTVMSNFRRCQDDTNKQYIFDYQKAGNDIPALAPSIMKLVHSAGFSRVIIFPFTSIEIGIEWIEAAYGAGLIPIVGAQLTQTAHVLEGIFEIAYSLGVINFVTPGTILNFTSLDFIPQGVRHVITCYVPGIGTQGGSPHCLSHFSNTIPIVGRSIYLSSNPCQTITDYCKQGEE